MTEPAAAAVAALVDAGVGAGDRRALARILSLVEDGGDDAHQVLTALGPRAPCAAVLGVTGAPGVGKSTLVDALVVRYRERGERVAVLAIDPSSPATGGALLGDRVRMQRHETDAGVFVRSMASRGRLGGLANAVPRAVRVLEAAGFSRIVLETVGVGQSEVDVAAAADSTVVVVTPGWGDAVQAAKAGLLEVADVLVVNHADRADPTATVRDLERHAAVTERGWRPPVVTTVAPGGEGLADLVAALDAHRGHLVASGALRDRRNARVHREVRDLVYEEHVRRADAVVGHTRFATVVAEVAAGRLDPYTASVQLLADEGRADEGRAR